MGTCPKEGPLLTLLATRDGPNITKYFFVKLYSVLHFSRPATPEVFAPTDFRETRVSLILSGLCGQDLGTVLVACA